MRAGHARRPRSSSATLSAPSQAGSVSGKCRPGRPGPARPSTASASAWHTASASLWPPRPRAPSIATPPSTSGRCGSSEKRWTSIPWPMRIAHRCVTRSFGRRSADVEVARRGDLQVAAAPRAPPHPCRRAPRPARRRRWPRVVRSSWARRRTLGPEGLGRLDGHQRAAVQGARHLPVSSTTLMVSPARDPGTAPSTPSSASGVDHRREEVGRGQRAGRVVHHDHLGVDRDRGQAGRAPTRPGWGRPSRRRRPVPAVPCASCPVAAVPRSRPGRAGPGRRRRSTAGTPRPTTRRTGRPASSANCLSPPKRRPEPPATTIDHTVAIGSRDRP